MRDNRPVNLDLFKFHFPLPALVSIVHRISGVVLFLGSPFILWAFMVSLESSSSYANLSWFLSQPLLRLLVWFLCSALAYHVCAGIKHLLMDFGVGETIKSAQITSVLTLISFSTLSFLLGMWLW